MILSDLGYYVIALDTDSVPNLAQSLGIPYEESSKIVPLVRNDDFVLERTGAKPGSTWGAIFKLNPRVDDIAEKYGLKIKENLRLVVVGSINASRQGCLCPAIALARRFLKYSLTRKEHVVIVDSEAGAEIFGRGLAENFNLMLVICEPTVKSLRIGHEMIRMGKELGIEKSIVIINKVADKEAAQKLADSIIGDRIQTFIVRFDQKLPEIEYKGLGLDQLPQDSLFLSDLRSLVENFILNQP